MCSKEDVQQIVSDSEKNMEKYVDTKLYEQQVELSKTVSNLVGDIQKSVEILQNTTTEAISSLSKKTTRNEKSISEIHDWRLVKDIKDTHSQEDIANIKNILSKIMWIGISGVILGVIGLIFK